MPVLKLEFPVNTLDKKPLLPAGAVLTKETIEALALSGPGDASPATPLMQYGTVRRDLARYMREGAYRTIFDDAKRNADLFGHMEKVRLARPLLDALGYFKRYDLYTYRHALMVFALSTLLVSDLGGDDMDAFLEATGGPLHDFGKICVPLPVLKKSTPLRRTERALLEHHTSAGYVLLSYYQKDPKSFAAKVARDHHERNDGSGYPLGIPLADRFVEIVVACDVYDALISQRPYRKVSFDNRTALEEITAMGEQGKVGWDVVRALVAHNRKNKPRARDCSVSAVKRGTPPEGNLYGVIVDDDPAVGAD